MKKLFIIIPIIILSISALIIFKPFEPKQKIMYVEPKPVSVNTSLPSGSEKIEVFAFHSTQRCVSCINVSNFVKSVINEKFINEFNSEKIIFKEVNIDLPENKQLAKDYQVSGSSLYITVTKDGQTFKEEDTDVWRYVPYETKFKNYFEAKIKKLL